jgi:hypothetical protein
VEKSIKKQTRPERSRRISRLAYGSLEMTPTNRGTVFNRAIESNINPPQRQIPIHDYFGVFPDRHKSVNKKAALWFISQGRFANN